MTASGLRIFLASLGIPEDRSCLRGFRELAAEDRHQKHVLTSSPEDADIVLFTETHLMDADWTQRAIRRHPVRMLFPERSYVYNERDNPWCSLPGLYVSYPLSAMDRHRQRACAYYSIPDLQPKDELPPTLLFSFMATPTHSSREVLYSLRHADAIVERTEGFIFYDDSSVKFWERKKAYLETLRRSAFVLCPRGGGLSSIRLYETLSAGRVPVIIADDWAPPDGPLWNSFSLRWPEGKTDGLVEFLEARTHLAATMGEKAREAFETWFARDVAFDRIGGLLEEIHTGGGARDFPSSGVRDTRWRSVLRSSARVKAGAWRRRLWT